MRVIQKKVCLLGDFAVGKTSLIRRYVEGRFDDKYLTTVGVVVSRKVLQYPNCTFHMLIWDMSGGRDFSQSSYLAGTAGAFLVCDLTRAATLANLQTYADQVRRVNPSARMILLANKSDLADDRAIPDEQLLAFAQTLAVPVELTSAKTGVGVEAAFRAVADALLSQTP
jgi:small GTP-binding protein